MSHAIVNLQGQITLPQEIQNHLKLTEGSQLDFVIDQNGDVKMIPLTTPVTRLSGILHKPGMQAATLEEMEASIIQNVRLTNTGEASAWT